MKRSERSALAALHKAQKTGAPFTTKGHPHHAACLSLERAGVLTGHRVGKKVFWGENDPASATGAGL